MRRKIAIVIWSLGLISVFLLWSEPALAGQLADRLVQFPNWDSKPQVQNVVAAEDLEYPEWMAGNWNVTSTLVDLAAPLAPEIVTPGFEGNRRYLNQPISFQVRFLAVSSEPSTANFQFLQLKTQNSKLKTPPVVADRAFNGLNIARAVLGDRAVLWVKIDPSNSNRQITAISGDRRLVLIVTGRATETPAPDRFISTEVSQQVFRTTSGIYLNEVENTIAYHCLQSADAAIEADQVTAVYLSPQDPQYFNARDKPISLYRYRLEFFPVLDKSNYN